MKKLLLGAVALLAIGALFAYAQNVPNPGQPFSLNGAYNATALTCTDGRGCWLQTDINGNLKTTSGSAGGYPGASTPITGNATGTTGAVVGTLASAASKFTYICGFSVSAIGGTATVGPITIAGTTGSSLVYQLASSAAGTTLSTNFTPCIPSSAVATAITITTTADGSATAVDVNSWGFQQ